MTDTNDAMTDWVMAGLFMTAAVAVVWYFPFQWLLDPASTSETAGWSAGRFKCLRAQGTAARISACCPTSRSR